MNLTSYFYCFENNSLIYYLLMNRTNFSRHQRKHLQRQRSILVRSLLYILSLLSTYWRTVRIILIIAEKEKLVKLRLVRYYTLQPMISDPKATVPKWKQKTLQKLVPMLVNGTCLLSSVQYHFAKTPAKIISPRPVANSVFKRENP